MGFCATWVERDGFARCVLLILAVTTIGSFAYSWGYYEGVHNAKALIQLEQTHDATQVERNNTSTDVTQHAVGVFEADSADAHARSSTVRKPLTPGSGKSKPSRRSTSPSGEGGKLRGGHGWSDADRTHKRNQPTGKPRSDKGSQTHQHFSPHNARLQNR